VLLFPIIAASLVLGTSGEVSPSFGLGSSVSRIDGDVPDTASADDVDDAPDRVQSRGAKHQGRSAAKPRVKASRRQRGRAVAVASRQAVDKTQSLRERLAPSLRPRDGSACPEGMVPIGDAFCIDVYEASLVQVLPGGEERAWPYYEVVPGDVVVRAVSLPGVYPQGYVSGVQAREACERSGKRLCKPDEWRNACMGPRSTVFPYGNTRVVGRCNDNGRSGMRLLNPQLDGKPEHRWMWGYAGNMVDPRLNQLEGTLTRTGERAGCTNEYGVFDMVGNLHEWVDDPDGTFQGGYYLDTHINGDGCRYRTTAHPVEHRDYSTGFRCCADELER